MNRNFWLLTLCQCFFMLNNITFTFVNGLVGLALAPVPWMATLPVTGYVVGSALATTLVARSQRAWGRKRSFQLGLLVGIASSGLCAFAAATGRFWLLVLATMLAGYYNANAALYRFVAMELVGPAYKERSISWVLAGGILGAVTGPNLARYTKDLLGTPFTGAYAMLVAFALVALAVMSFISFPALPRPDPARPGRSLREIARQPVFVVAVAASALGYGVMNLLMSATPIAMTQMHHSFDHAALVIEWHVLAMFTPSFFTGQLIKRFGVLRVMWVGLAANLACIVIALSGVAVMQFLVALVLLGVGWNFLFIGGTTLFTEAYRAEEKTTVQSTMDFCIYSTMAITSFASGALITTRGWEYLNWGSLVPMGALAVALVYLAVQRRTASLAA
ncbi:MFS transporter [Corallococcus carmarthensis]|uniref:MFS transporter n=1 Tax=Corallococcus carmarthensis TaxID=2316728 RepID=A0A3A8KII3_9BACT|nr:MFS transporter [Corallococcus carmarthensis]NOK15702.1 MFS transporter [Corallococcus carmarthensis]RKH07376.1 MFS transporter [Corallococcus carmarthensis]